MRGILFDEGAARAVAARLLADGWTAVVGRDRLAGEDDDEDHPWAVSTDAPSYVLDVLLDAHDGWLDEEAPPPPAGGSTPLVLPTAPRRIAREP